MVFAGTTCSIEQGLGRAFQERLLVTLSYRINLRSDGIFTVSIPIPPCTTKLTLRQEKHQEGFQDTDKSRFHLKK